MDRDTTQRAAEDAGIRKQVSIWRLMIHVLPRGYRRVRDFGFLHGNAKRTRAAIQPPARLHSAATRAQRSHISVPGLPDGDDGAQCLSAAQARDVAQTPGN